MHKPPKGVFRRPDLPAAALHGLPGQVAREISESYGTDEAAALLMFLTMFGNAVGREPFALINDSEHHARLFAVVVGDAAEGRKGTAYDAVLNLFRKADPYWARLRVLSGLQSPEAVIDRVSEEDGNDPRLLLCERELSRLIRLLERRNFGALLRDAWDGATLSRQKASAKGSQHATRAHVSLIGHITPAELQKLHAPLRESGGLETRILYAISAPATVGLIDPFKGVSFNDHLVTELEAALVASRRDEETPIPYARTVRWTKYQSRMPVVARDYQNFTRRGVAQLVRLALTYALADGSHQITNQHLEAGLALWTYCANSAERIFSMQAVPRQPDINARHLAKVIDRLFDAYPEWVPRLTLETEVLQRNVGKDEFNNLMRHLIEHEESVEWRRVGTQGRPRIEYRFRDPK